MNGRHVPLPRGCGAIQNPAYRPAGNFFPPVPVMFGALPMLIIGRILSYLPVRSAMIGIADGIEVMRVLHGRRDIQQAYFDF
jgi:hypothetical protein